MRAICLLIVLLFPITLFGQEGKPVGCRFLGFGAEDSKGTVLNLNPKGDPIVCPLPSGKLSAKVECFAVGANINFISPIDKSLVASATVPAGANNLILIFTKKPQDKAVPAISWNVYVVEDSEKKFPSGGTMVVNFYDKDIRFILGEHKGMLRPKTSNGYAMPAKRNTFNMAEVMFESFNGKDWRPLTETGFRFLPGTRYLIVSYNHPKTKHAQVSIISDIK